MNYELPEDFVPNRRASLVRLILVAALTLVFFAPLLPAQESTNDTRVSSLLAVRKQQQIEASASLKAFHVFQFADRVAESGITFDHQMVDDAGKNWKAAHYDHGNGLAVADVDGDGLYDLYFVTQLGSNELWRNRGGGKFENITARAGVGLTDQICVAASFADIDNDGDPDLFVTTVRHGNHLFENLGGGRFRDISQAAGVDYVGHSSGATFFDFDNDGRLDLFVANVGRFTIEEKGRGGFYLAWTNAFGAHLVPERTEYSILYRNLGDRKFENVSARLNLLDGSWSGDAVFADLNGDGFPDLYVLNMQGDNHYYENLAGRKFVEKTAALFPKTPWGAMGAKFFDYNNDGRLDLYVTDMHSDMTSIQTKAARNLPLNLEKVKSESYCTAANPDAFLQGASNNIFGNAFYENKGAGQFAEVSDAINAETYWPWGPSVGDLNADGFADVFVTAGMGYPFRYAINSVLLNEGGRKFFDSEFLLGVEPRTGGRIEKNFFRLDCSGADKGHPLCEGKSGRSVFKGALSTRSAAVFDLDDDGDLDIVTAEFNDRPQMLISNLTAKRKPHFLKIKLVGAVSNRDGLGAMVKVHAGTLVQTQLHDGKSGYLAQSSLPLYFGLGAATKAERVEVSWPSGRKQVVTDDLPADSLLTLREPAR